MLVASLRARVCVSGCPFLLKGAWWTSCPAFVACYDTSLTKLLALSAFTVPVCHVHRVCLMRGLSPNARALLCQYQGCCVGPSRLVCIYMCVHVCFCFCVIYSVYILCVYLSMQFTAVSLCSHLINRGTGKCCAKAWPFDPHNLHHRTLPDTTCTSAHDLTQSASYRQNTTRCAPHNCVTRVMAPVAG